MTNLASCADPANDPQDWFIRPDGKQYAFEDLLSKQEIESITLTVLGKAGETESEHAARVESALSAARGNRKRASLKKRRHAVALCWSDCPVREACFEQQMEQRNAHGTWGGRTEEQWVEIRDTQDGRRNLRLL